MYFFATVKRNPFLLYHDADTEESSSGSPVVVAEILHKDVDGNDDPTTGLAVIAIHTQDSSKRQSNIATLLTPLIKMLSIEPLAEDKCQTEMKDQGSHTVDTQMSVADELSIANAEASLNQKENSEVANVMEVCKFMT